MFALTLVHKKTCILLRLWTADLAPTLHVSMWYLQNEQTLVADAGCVLDQSFPTVLPRSLCRMPPFLCLHVSYGILFAALNLAVTAFYKQYDIYYVPWYILGIYS